MAESLLLADAENSPDVEWAGPTSPSPAALGEDSRGIAPLNRRQFPGPETIEGLKSFPGCRVDDPAHGAAHYSPTNGRASTCVIATSSDALYPGMRNNPDNRPMISEKALSA